MDMSREEYIKRCQDVKERFIFHGVSVLSWARRNGFNPQTVYDVLNGRAMAERGEAHRVAVALKIKRGSMEDIAI